MSAAEHDRPDVGHETTDADAGLLFYALAGLAVLLILVFVAMWLLFMFLNSDRPEGIGRQRNVQIQEEGPPEPRLQTSPAADLKEMREHEDQLLNSYGWVNKAAGIVRIPVSRAMEIVGRKGLPHLGPIGVPDETRNPFGYPEQLPKPIATGTEATQPAAPGAGPAGLRTGPSSVPPSGGGPSGKNP
jgi:hypothetical protein